MTSIRRELLFSELEYEQRLKEVKRVMTERRVDLLLLHSLPAIHYLTGFQTAALRAYCCLALSADDFALLVTERDEKYNAFQNAWIDNVATYARWEDPVQVTLGAVNASGQQFKTVGIEKGSRYLSPAQFDQFHEAFSAAQILDATDIVPGCMLIKSAAELDYIRQAAAITVRGMRSAIEAVDIGRTDNEIAAAAFFELIAGGSEYMSSDPIVCVGQNSAIPHGHFRNRRVASGDTVLLEMSACAGRYSAPLMRAIAIGKPDPVVVSMASACKEALEAIILEMGPGLRFADAAARGKKLIARAGDDMIFHGTYAYSIGAGFPGVSWADCPIEVRERGTEYFVPGMVFHLPISLRYQGRFGVAVSETVAITELGTEVLTCFPRELVVK